MVGLVDDDERDALQFLDRRAQVQSIVNIDAISEEPDCRLWDVVGLGE